MMLIATTASASTSSRWMNPPIVYELTIPRTHSTSRITKIVHNMASISLRLSQLASEEAPVRNCEDRGERERGCAQLSNGVVRRDRQICETQATGNTCDQQECDRRE